MTATSSPAPIDLGVPGPVDIESIPWVVSKKEWGTTEMKILRASLRENCYTVRLRWKAGLKVPKHRHFGIVHAFTHSGKWHYKEYDWFATSGSYVVETPETEHSLVVDEDVEATFIVHGGQVDVTDDQRALAGYQALLELHGMKLPTGIVDG
jgi:anti-sigma factor ChrR (cupin superfamily)